MSFLQNKGKFKSEFLYEINPLVKADKEAIYKLIYDIYSYYHSVNSGGIGKFSTQWRIRSKSKGGRVSKSPSVFKIEEIEERGRKIQNNKKIVSKNQSKSPYESNNRVIHNVQNIKPLKMNMVEDEEMNIKMKMQNQFQEAQLQSQTQNVNQFGLIQNIPLM